MVWKSLRGDLLYRVGDVFISTNSQNPSSYYGGAWQLLCPGRTLVCIDTSQSEFNTVKKTGGEKTHKLSIAELPSHNHWTALGTYTNTGTPTPSGSNNILLNGWGSDNPYRWQEYSLGGKVGSDNYHNNLQPYMAVYMWVRVS